MRESCSATACSLTRSRPHRLASLWRSLSPSSSPKRSFHGNSRISSGFHGGGQGNVSHNASGFEYRCVTNSPSLHSRSVLLLHLFCVHSTIWTKYPTVNNVHMEQMKSSNPIRSLFEMHVNKGPAFTSCTHAPRVFSFTDFLGGRRRFFKLTKY